MFAYFAFQGLCIGGNAKLAVTQYDTEALCTADYDYSNRQEVQ